MTRRWLPWAPIIVAPIVLFSPVLFTGKLLYWGTSFLQFIPWHSYAWEQLSGGTLPLWNPLNGMGAPLAANYQTAFFYPPGWLLFIASWVGGNPGLAWAYGLLAAAHLAWGGLGMAVLARRLGLNPLAQTIAGMAFGLSGYLVARVGFFSMIWAGAWVPWVIWAASQIAIPGDEGKPFSGKYVSFPLVGAIAMQLLSGHAQLSWYTLLLAGVWVIAGGWSTRQRGSDRWKNTATAFLSFCISAAAGAAIASVQLLPTLEYLLQSSRSSAVDAGLALTYSYSPWRLLTLFAPNLFGTPVEGNFMGYATYWEDHAYMGVLPLLLACGTFHLVWRKRGHLHGLVRFLWVVTILGFAMAMGKWSPLYMLLYRWVPTFDMFQGPARYLIWSSFSLALLAGIAINGLAPFVGKRLIRLRLSIAAALAVSLGAFGGWMLLEDIEGSLIKAFALAGMIAAVAGALLLVMPEASSPRRKVWSWAVVLFVAVDLIAFQFGLNPAGPKQFYTSKVKINAELRAIAGDGRIYIPHDVEYLLKFDRFFVFEDFTKPFSPAELRWAMLPNSNLLERIPSANNFDPMVPIRYSRWMEQVEAASEAEADKWLALMGVGAVEVIADAGDGEIFFRPIGEPSRMSWWSCAEEAGDAEDALERVEERIQRGGSCLIIEGDDGGQASVADAVMTLVASKPDEVVIEVETDAAGWLRLADMYYPGWRAEVDHSQVKLLAADSAFRAVAVGAGKHIVRFSYRPFSFNAGLMITLLALAGIFVWNFIRQNRR